jgi:hypothetical protein
VLADDGLAVGAPDDVHCGLRLDPGVGEPAGQGLTVLGSSQHLELHLAALDAEFAGDGILHGVGEVVGAVPLPPSRMVGVVVGSV